MWGWGQFPNQPETGWMMSSGGCGQWGGIQDVQVYRERESELDSQEILRQEIGEKHEHTHQYTYTLKYTYVCIL